LEDSPLLATDVTNPPLYLHVPHLGRTSVFMRDFIREIPNGRTIQDNSKSSFAVSVVVSVSFEELLDRVDSFSSCERFLKIPCLFLTKSSFTEWGIDKIRSELDSARRISGIWPVIVVSEVKHKHNYEELFPLFSSIARIGHSVISLNQTLIKLDNLRYCISDIVNESKITTLLRRFIAGSIGSRFLESCEREIQSILRYKQSIDNDWAAVIRLSSSLESECLRDFGASANDNRANLLDWLHGDVWKIYQLVSRAYNYRVDTADSLNATEEITNAIVFNSFSSDEIQGVCSCLGYSAHNLRSFLNTDEQYKKFAYVDDSLSLNRHFARTGVKNDEDCLPDTINEHEGFFSPVEGELIWIGPSSVLIHTLTPNQGCSLWICKEPSSEPCSHLSVGSKLYRNQRLFHRTHKSSSPRPRILPPNPVSVLRSYKISQACSMTSGVVGDIISSFPWDQMSSSRLSAISLDEDSRTKWLGVPLKYDGEVKFSPNMEVLSRFRAAIRKPTLALNKDRIDFMLKRDIGKMKKSLDGFAHLSKEQEMSNNISKEVFENTIAVQESFLFVYNCIVKERKAKLAFSVREAVSNQLKDLKSQLELAKLKRKKDFDGKKFPESYDFLRHSLENLDSIVLQIIRETNALTAFIGGIHHALTKSDYDVPNLPQTYLAKYWEAKILRFPQECEHWDRKKSERRKWIENSFDLTINELSQATNSWQTIPELCLSVSNMEKIDDTTKNALESSLSNSRGKYNSYMETMQVLKNNEIELIEIAKDFNDVLNVINDSYKLWGYNDA